MTGADATDAGDAGDAGGSGGDETGDGGHGGGGGDGTEAAVERLDEARRERGLADPRPTYRKLLRRLASEDREAYREAVRHFEEELVPSVAGGGADPVKAWLRYGLRLVSVLSDGEPLGVDESGRAEPVEDPDDPPVGPLVLWLPTSPGDRGLVLARPEELSDPQRATVELLT